MGGLAIQLSVSTNLTWTSRPPMFLAFTWDLMSVGKMCHIHPPSPSHFHHGFKHSYDILGARMLWKPKEARILKKI